MDRNSNVIILDNKRKVNIEPTPTKTVQKKKNRMKLFACVLVVAGMVFVLSAFGRFVWSGHQLSLEINHYLSQLEDAKIHNAQLLQELEQIQDPIFMERLARERLGLIRAGETVIIPTVPGISATVED